MKSTRQRGELSPDLPRTLAHNLLHTLTLHLALARRHNAKGTKWATHISRCREVGGPFRSASHCHCARRDVNMPTTEGAQT